MRFRALQRRAGQYVIIEPASGNRLQPDLDGRSARRFTVLASDSAAPCVLCGRRARARLVLWPDDAGRVLPGDARRLVEAADWVCLQAAVCGLHGDRDTYTAGTLHQIESNIAGAFASDAGLPVLCVAHWCRPRRQARARTPKHTGPGRRTPPGRHFVSCGARIAAVSRKATCYGWRKPNIEGR